MQFATVTISLAEKDIEEPAAFLIKERSQLALYAPDVEKVYNDVKALASSRSRGMQITNAQLNRDYSGRISATVSMLIAPEESNAVITRVKFRSRRKFPNPNRTCRARRQRHVRERKNQARQGGAQYHDLSRGTGVSANHPADSHVVRGRKGKASSNRCRETRWTRSQL